MITRHDLRTRREEITRLAARHGARDLRVFGSVARGDATAASDLDLLVRFDADRSLMDHGMLVEELQDLLKVRVDVVSEAALAAGDRFGERLAREAVPL
ncbi:MAG TPA: nucleotidyltransferase domain-containing protein [Humisphaera sp.]